MKGFKIIAKSEKGEECILTDINTNKKVFDVITARSKPYMQLDFLFRRSPQARMMKKMFSIVPDKEAEDHISKKMIELGAVRGKDFEVSVIA